jgi:hypothetical protein
VSHDLVRSIFRAIDARDWGSLADYFHPELRYQRPGFPTLEGRDEVLRFFREIRAIHGSHQIEGIAIDGDQGAHWGRFVGAKMDGTPVDVEYADWYRFRDGLLWRRKSFFYVALGV